MIPLDYRPLQDYLRQQRDVVVAYLFGSAARGQMTPMSDVDVAVLLDAPPDNEFLIERQLELLTDLERMVEPELQIVLLNHAPPLLAYEVIREGVLLHERSSGERVAFQVRAMKEYFDIQPMLARQDKALRRQIQEVGLGRRTTSDPRTLETARRLHQRFTAVATS
jgi:uncharacterized protein